MAIHPTAVIEDGAELGDVVVGPYAVIGADVVLHDGVMVGSHAVIEAAVVGPGTQVGAHAVLGGAPQDLKHDPGTPTRLIIGARNVFREFTSAHRGSSRGAGETRIGDDNYFMANSHVAHDCVVGNHTMFANSVAIGGYVVVEDGAVLGGLSAVHQHARVGRLAMLGGGAMCSQDVPPFSIAQGDRARLVGLNITGLRRGGLTDPAITAIKEAWRTLFVGELPRRLAISQVAEALGEVPEVAELLAFLRASARGVCRSALQA
ncbi:MAG TPA: acyl-ACP--UDP-N-acetylglucosamine O-acyltransferase [Deltaproteobacteria bacterium]|nr:acyl-ACP--UDP-N-acetylglucosamine O-acyltransferase [Deltaproteobacteria bacterium]